MASLSRCFARICVVLAASTGARALAATAIPVSTALSPDGTLIAWTLRVDAGPGTAQGPGPAVHVTAVANPDPAKEKLVVPNGGTGCSSADPVWSPDSQTLAFKSDCLPPGSQPKQEQIFLWTRASGEVKQLTHLTGDLDQLAWSPDGRTIAFLFVENASRKAGALDAMKPPAGVIGEDGIEVQRVAAVDIDHGNRSMVTPPGLHVFEFAWRPDSKAMCFIAANPPGENNWWIAKLYTEELLDLTRGSGYPGSESRNTAGEQPVVVLDPNTVSGPLHGLQMAVPQWSRDGKRLAFIGGLMSDQGSTGGDLWVVDARAGATPVDVTPGIDGTVCHESWVGNDHIGFVENRRGHTLVLDWDVAAKAAVPGSTLDLGEVTIGGGPVKDAPSFSPANGGLTVFTMSSFKTPPEIWAAGASAARQITHLNDGLKPAARTESVEWENEGFHVQGWLTYPANYDSGKHYPLLVQVHGGPSADAGAQWGGASDWSGRGYFFFQPNPRGSFGQGEAFTAANVKDFGYGDLRDILKGLDTLEARLPIDKHREGLMGWSYGGFMTMFAVTQTHRFRAAVAGAGISDWLSYYGENSIDQWMVPFFGKTVYDDPAVYAKSSAITFIKNVTTPTLVIVGDRDGECPAPQSFEFWHALRELGVPTQLVVYPAEGHRFSNPEHIRDRTEREVRWFAEQMPAK